MSNSAADPSKQEQVGYLTLISSNTNFRRLWLGTLVSQLGDWFNTIALYSLVAGLTGSPLAMGAIFLFKLLPWALVSPLAGVLVDRYNRRQIMIVSDLMRAVVVLGFIFIDDASQVPLVYLLITLQVVLGAVFLPSKSASIPNITSDRELLTANALSAATWSIMLALGAGLGGLATEYLGTDTVFILDSITYLLSAYFIFRARIPQDTVAPAAGNLIRSAYKEILEGWAYMRAVPRVGRIALAKATWAVGGGATVYMLTLLGQEVMPGAEAAGIGVLFFARGLGTGIGPVVSRALFKDQRVWPAVLGASIVVSGIFYATVGWTASIAWIIFAVVAAHAASGANWVFATVLLQQRSVDRLRGRVFGSEWLFVLFMESVSILCASIVLEMAWLDLQQAFICFALVQVICGVLWLGIIVPAEKNNAQEEGM
ncbi:MAG: MFS transporter [Bacteroidota bacterium]